MQTGRVRPVRRAGRAAVPTIRLLLAACGGGGGQSSTRSGGAPQTGTPAPPIRDVTSMAITSFGAPWSTMAFLPDGRLLVTERVTGEYDPGKLWLTTQTGQSTAATGLPAISACSTSS